MDVRRRFGLAMTMAGLAIGLVAGPVSAADEAVTIAGFAFDPASVTVRVGDSVTWTNQDSAAHTATASGTFASGDLANGQSFTYTFTTAGTFDYICAIHPTMAGTVVVQAAAGAGSPPPTDTEVTPDPDRDGHVVTLTLAFLGFAMLAGTIVAEWRVRQGR
ncbi:MAG: cupredoxin domain-containing protein [Candidatus Limnocylindrales bacterium]